MGFLLILAVLAIIALISFVEAWLIAFVAGLLGIQIAFKIIFFIVLIVNLFFRS